MLKLNFQTMRKLSLLMLVVFSSLAVMAQSPYTKGEKQLNGGFGLSSWGLPVYIGLDYAVHDDITVGGELSFRSYNEKIGTYKYDHSVIGVSGNGNYHFNTILEIPDNWDVYAGLNLGFYIWNSPNSYTGSHTSDLGFGAQIGGRYYFSDKVSLNLEFGGGNAFSGGKIGISVFL